MKIFLRNSAILLGSTMTVMAGAAVSPALPSISAHFKNIPDHEILVKLILTAPALSIAVIAPFTGLILDRLGRRPVLLFCLALYSLSGTAGFYLHSLSAIIISRAVLGIAVSGIMTGFIALIADYFEGGKLNRFMGIQAAFMGFGGVVFIFTGGLLADINWRCPFLIYFFSILILPLVYFFLPEPAHKVGPETKLRDMFKLPHDFNRRPVIFIYAAALFCMLAFYLMPVQLPFLLKEVVQSSNTQIGTVMAVMILCSSSMSMRYRWFKSKMSHELILTLNLGILGLGYLIVSFADSLTMVITGMIVAGLGVGTFWPNMNVWLVKFAPPDMRGRIYGGLTTCICLGQFLSPVLVKPLNDSFGITGCFLFTGILLIFMVSLYSAVRAQTKAGDS